MYDVCQCVYQIFNIVATVGVPNLGYMYPWASEGEQGVKLPLDFENFSQKGCFLSFE